MKNFRQTIGLLLLISLAPSVAAAQSGKEVVAAHIEAGRAHYANVAQQIWDLAEVGYQEEKSSGLLQSELKAAGFTVDAGVAGMPTAFIASYGSGEPVIGIRACVALRRGGWSSNE